MVNYHGWLPDWPLADCFLCGSRISLKSALCTHCRKELTPTRFSCTSCGIPLPQNGTCGQCFKHPPPTHRVISGLIYKPPTNFLIHAFKYQRQLAILSELADSLGHNIIKTYTDDLPQVLYPVPLHAHKRRERGFNQARLIADTLKRSFRGLQVANTAKRIHKTRSQYELSRHSRAANVKNAFHVEAVVNEHVAIVDDVVTTGATVNAFACELRRRGAKRVDVWCLARAI